MSAAGVHAARGSRSEQARRAILDLCELLSLVPTAEQLDELAARDLGGLDELRVYLKTHRRWP